MNRAQVMLIEFDHEMAKTRKTLERLPEDRFDWRPHPKSFTMRELGTHLAFIPFMGKTALTTERFDVVRDGAGMRPPKFDSRAEVLALFDRNAAEMRALLEKTEDEAMLQPWTLQADGKEIFTTPRIATLRNMVLNHMIHHRGQLTIYLRLCDVPVPAIYGPSADEAAF